MPQLVSDDHFTTGLFASIGPELFRSHTCMECGGRSKTWAAFCAHRQTCVGRLTASGGEFGEGLLARLAALVEGQLQSAARPHPEPEPEAPEADEARDPILDAPPAALRALERWRRELEAQVTRERREAA